MMQAAAVFFAKALAYPGATTAVALTGLYPAIVAVISATFFGEKLVANQLVGVALACASALAFARS